MSLASASHPLWTRFVAPVVVVGDVMLDRYIWGETERISPEAPVPVVRVEQETATAGGAANVALNLAALGVPVHLVGVVGDDIAGTQLRGLLAERGIAFTNVAAGNPPTITKTRVLARGQQMLRLDEEREPIRYAPSLEEMERLVQQIVPHAVAVLVSDYGKGVVDSGWLPQWRAATRFLAVDPKPRRPVAWPEPDFLAPNWGEAWQLVGHPGKACTPESRTELAALLEASGYTREVLVTLGSDGMALMAAGKEVLHLPAHAREVFDVSGAGDSVFALYAVARAQGATASEAAQVANAAAAVVVAKVGTAIAQADEIQAVLAQLN